MLEKFEIVKNSIVGKIPPIYHGAFLTFNPQEADWVRNTAYDGYTYYYNKNWVLGLKDDELELIVLHDILHYVCGHPFELKATSQNPKSVQIYMLECDKHIERLIEKLGYEPFIKPNIASHDIWLKPHEVVGGIKKGLPWLKHNVIYETEKAKCAELSYCYNIGENDNSFYQFITGYKSITAFFAYNHKGELIRVTRRNKDVKELIEVYNLAQRLADTPEENI